MDNKYYLERIHPKDVNAARPKGAAKGCAVSRGIDLTIINDVVSILGAGCVPQEAREGERLRNHEHT